MTRLHRICLVAALLIAAMSLAGPARAQEEVTYANTVTVAAGASVELEADIATLTFGVRARSDDASTATRRVGRKTRSVVAALEAAGVTDEELTVGGVSLRRSYDRRGTPTGYVASVAVKVKTERLGALGRIIDAGVAGGAGSLRLAYNVKDRTAAVDQALRDAMVLARAKATALAEADGRQVGPAIVISEYNATPPRAVSYEAAGLAGGSAADTSTIPLEAPILSAKARITVTFELI